MRSLLKIALISGLTTGILACNAGYDLSGSDDDTSDGDVDLSGTYIGPANDEFWELSFFDDDTFELEKRSSFDSDTALYTVEGDVEQLDSGFYELTVTEGADDGSVDGDVVYIMRVSNTLTIAYPIEPDDSELYIAIRDSRCPSSSLSGNFVGTQFALTSNLESTAEPVFGLFSYSASDEQITIETAYAVDEDFTSAREDEVLVANDCDDGITNTSEVEGEQQYLSSDGAAIFPYNGGRFLLTEHTDLSAASDTDGDYIGFMVNTGIASGNLNRIVYASCEDGSCTIGELDDIESISDATDLYTMDISSNLDDPTSGFINGTLTSINDSTSGTVVCNFDGSLSDGNQFLSCVAQSPENNADSVNLYLVTDD